MNAARPIIQGSPVANCGVCDRLKPTARCAECSEPTCDDHLVMDVRPPADGVMPKRWICTHCVWDDGRLRAPDLDYFRSGAEVSHA